MKKLLYILPLLLLVSCSLSRQSPLSRKLFVKKQTNIVDKSQTPDTLAALTQFSNYSEHVNENSISAEQNKTTPSKEKPKEAKITLQQLKRNFKKTTQPIFLAFSQFNDSDTLTESNYKKFRELEKTKTYSIAGMILSILGFISLMLAILLGIGGVGIIISLVFLGLAVIFGAISLILSTRAKRYIIKYRSSDEKVKMWKRRYVMANLGILFSMIIAIIFVVVGIGLGALFLLAL